ncbi:YbaN family protein [Robertmurraya sp. Marseille-Q9965]
MKSKKGISEGDSIKKFINIIFIISGFLSLGIGLVGILLPVVPTTPLLLLASFCFMKGSKKFETWFKGTEIYEKNLQDFVINKWMTLKQKVFLNLFADCMIVLGFFAVDNWIVRGMLILIVIYKYYYFFTKIETRRAPK